MKIPILTYHRISPGRVVNTYTIEEQKFNNQLKLLYDNNYKCISVDEFYQFLLNPMNGIPEKSAIVTFDDGSESDYLIALPLLKKYKFKATFFITSDWIGKPGYMNSIQIRSLKEEGMSIQSHAKTHSFLDGLTTDELNSELVQSKKSLEDILGERVSFISFPGGRYNKRVVEYASKNGYSALLCSQPFLLKWYNNIHIIGRYGISQTSTIRNFEKVIHNDIDLRLKAIVSYYGKSIMKKTLGNNIYHYLWKRYINKTPHVYRPE